jgi:hypothetical protein
LVFQHHGVIPSKGAAPLPVVQPGLSNGKMRFIESVLVASNALKSSMQSNEPSFLARLNVAKDPLISQKFC